MSVQGLKLAPVLKCILVKHCPLQEALEDLTQQKFEWEQTKVCFRATAVYVAMLVYTIRGTILNGVILFLPHPQQRHGYQLSQLNLRLAEIEQDKEELLRLKNAELSEMGMQLSSAQREGERVQAELKEQTGNVQSLRKKLDTALVRLLVECLWFGLQLWLELFWRVSECVFGNEKVKVNVYIGSFCVFITKNGQ